MQKNYVNMQDKNFDIQGTYAFSKLPIFFKICFNMENSFYLPEHTKCNILMLACNIVISKYYIVMLTCNLVISKYKLILLTRDSLISTCNIISYHPTKL